MMTTGTGLLAPLLEERQRDAPPTPVLVRTAARYWEVTWGEGKDSHCLRFSLLVSAERYAAGLLAEGFTPLLARHTETGTRRHEPPAGHGLGLAWAR